MLTKEIIRADNFMTIVLVFSSTASLIMLYKQPKKTEYYLMGLPRQEGPAHFPFVQFLLVYKFSFFCKG